MLGFEREDDIQKKQTTTKNFRSPNRVKGVCLGGESHSPTGLHWGLVKSLPVEALSGENATGLVL